MTTLTELEGLEREINSCRACPRLVAWREQVARDKRAAYANEEYWGRPVPGFGDPRARIIVIGLAPGAHGANRTGRVFTGDRSGDWLYRALFEAGLANQPTSQRPGDGLVLRDAWVTAAVRCAPPDNKPSTEERTRCEPFILRELALLQQRRVVVALGAFAHAAALRVLAQLDVEIPRPRPKFGHGAEAVLGDGTVLIDSFHPSQQNTFTGRLTQPMLADVFERAVAAAKS